MAQQKTVDIELGGKVRTMRLDFNAFCALDEQGHSIKSLNANLGTGKFPVSTMRLLLWAVLASDTSDPNEANYVPGFTPGVFGKWLNEDNVSYCWQKLGEFLRAQPKVANPTTAGETGQAATSQ